MLNVGALFVEEPDHWQLRGDQLLWAEFAQTLADTPAPIEPRELERLLEDAFWNATGNSLSFASQIIVARFADEGKSRGGISGADWRYRLFPLVLARFKAASLESAAS